MTKPKRRPVTLVRSSYQPSKAEQEEPIELPEGTTPDDLAEAVVQSVDVTWKPRPSALPYIIPLLKAQQSGRSLVLHRAFDLAVDLP